MFIFCAFCALSGITTAQTSADQGRNHKIPATIGHDSKFANTEMTNSGYNVSFSNLPELPKPTWAYVTNEDGEIVKQARLNIDQHEFNVGKLQNGLYFVSLVYRSKTEKAFVLQLSN